MLPGVYCGEHSLALFSSLEISSPDRSPMVATIDEIFEFWVENWRGSVAG